MCFCLYCCDTCASHVCAVTRSHFPVIVYYWKLVINTTKRAKAPENVLLLPCQWILTGSHQLACRGNNKHGVWARVRLYWLFPHWEIGTSWLGWAESLHLSLITSLSLITHFLKWAQRNIDFHSQYSDTLPKESRTKSVQDILWTANNII